MAFISKPQFQLRISNNFQGNLYITHYFFQITFDCHCNNWKLKPKCSFNYLFKKFFEEIVLVQFISTYLYGSQIHKELHSFTEPTAAKYANVCQVLFCETKLEETKEEMTGPCPHRVYRGRDIQIFTDTRTIKKENKQDDVTWKVLPIRQL